MNILIYTQLIELIGIDLKRLYLYCLKVIIKRIQLKRLHIYSQYVKIRRFDFKIRHFGKIIINCYNNMESSDIYKDLKGKLRHLKSRHFRIKEYLKLRFFNGKYIFKEYVLEKLIIIIKL